MLADWPSWLWLTVSALAVYRLTVLITLDLITEPVREAVKRLGEPWATGIECPWCVSIWVSALSLLFWAGAPGVWQIAAIFLTFSAITGLLSTLTEN